MARPSLCLSCASFPVKDRSAAARSQQCPECKTDIGVTSYGVHFRMSAKRKKIITPNFLQGAMIGAGLLALVIALVSVPLWIEDKAQIAHHRAPAVDAKVADSLSRIPEVSLQDPFAATVPPEEAKASIRTLIGQITQMNAAKQDGFLLAQIDRRKEIRGLPFIMGDACKMESGRAVQFQNEVTQVRSAVDAAGLRGQERHVAFWTMYPGGANLNKEPSVAALSQILGPEQASMRATFAQHLRNANVVEASRVLAKAAIFDSASEVRHEALKALKDRAPEQYTEILLQGLRYPMAVVANRAAAAIIQLDRKDILGEVAAVLGEAPPGDPVPNDQNGCTVREVVRVNHHRNCLMCHAPSMQGTSQEVPGLIPTPGMPFPSTSREYYGDSVTRGEPAVRADTTYLRQDFSVMLPVANAAPWPELQRYDFLVRTRVVEGHELEVLKQRVRDRAADFLSANHQAALRVLRDLTGQNAEPTQAAWQRVLGTEEE